MAPEDDDDGGQAPEPVASWYYGQRRLEMVDLLPARTTAVLDVGCGEGAFLDALRERRPDLRLAGIEPVETAGAAARRRGLHVVSGSFPDDVPDGEAFDCIVFNDVLEHVVDPWDALRAAREVLGDGGCVVASIPNVRNLETLVALVRRGRWDYVDAGVLDRTHLRFFTRATILELFAGAGFEVVSIRGGFALGGRRWRLLRAMSILGGRTLWRESLFRQFHLVAEPAFTPSSSAPR